VVLIVQNSGATRNALDAVGFPVADGVVGCCQNPWPIQSNSRQKRKTPNGTPTNVANALAGFGTGAFHIMTAKSADQSKSKTQPTLAMPRLKVSMVHPINSWSKIR
jgi:hypothetical protein